MLRGAQCYLRGAGDAPLRPRSGICTQYLQWRRGRFMAWSFVCQKFRKWCHGIGERCGVRMFGNSPRSGYAQNPFQNFVNFSSCQYQLMNNVQYQEMKIFLDWSFKLSALTL